MQLRPLLTGANGSPWVATTRPAWVPTRTEHPVPQKRQGAFSQEIFDLSSSTIRLVATAGILMPATAAAEAAALALINSRLLSFIIFVPSGLCGSIWLWLYLVVNKRGAQYMIEAGYFFDDIGDVSLGL